MTRKSNASSAFAGHWRITSMEMWDEDFIHAQGEGFFEFDAKDSSCFQFGYVNGDMDCWSGTRDGKPCVEWSFEGNDEMTLISGRGWAVADGDQLTGFIAIHQGDGSQFVAKKIEKPCS